MGLHLSLMTADLAEDHPEWDWLRQQEDYAFVDLLRTLPAEVPDWGEWEKIWRPLADSLDGLDIAIETSPELTNKARYHQFVNHLREDAAKQWWVYAST